MVQLFLYSSRAFFSILRRSFHVKYRKWKYYELNAAKRKSKQNERNLVVLNNFAEKSTNKKIHSFFFHSHYKRREKRRRKRREKKRNRMRIRLDENENENRSKIFKCYINILSVFFFASFFFISIHRIHIYIIDVEETLSHKKPTDQEEMNEWRKKNPEEELRTDLLFSMNWTSIELSMFVYIMKFIYIYPDVCIHACIEPI